MWDFQLLPVLFLCSAAASALLLSFLSYVLWHLIEVFIYIFWWKLLNSNLHSFCSELFPKCSPKEKGLLSCKYSLYILDIIPMSNICPEEFFLFLFFIFISFSMFLEKHVLINGNLFPHIYIYFYAFAFYFMLLKSFGILISKPLLLHLQKYV